jgi:hypothetical protein
LQTEYHTTKILQTETDCKQFDETVEHIISACQILGEEQYIKRHDRVCAELSFTICKEIGIKLDNVHRNDHVLKSVETSHEGEVTVLWNEQVRTDRTITNNK